MTPFDKVLVEKYTQCFSNPECILWTAVSVWDKRHPEIRNLSFPLRMGFSRLIQGTSKDVKATSEPSSVSEVLVVSAAVKSMFDQRTVKAAGGLRRGTCVCVWVVGVSGKCCSYTPIFYRVTIVYSVTDATCWNTSTNPVKCHYLCSFRASLMQR